MKLKESLWRKDYESETKPERKCSREKWVCLGGGKLIFIPILSLLYEIKNSSQFSLLRSIGFSIKFFFFDKALSQKLWNGSIIIFFLLRSRPMMKMMMLRTLGLDDDGEENFLIGRERRVSREKGSDLMEKIWKKR